MDIDQRRSPRIDFFVVPDDEPQLPGWVTHPPGAAEPRGGIVVNLSEDGLQVMCAAEPVLDAPHYELRLLLGEDGDTPLFTASVRRVWTRPLSRIVQLCGLEFESDSSQAEEFLRVQTTQVSARKWVRCELVERMTSLA